MSAHETEAHRLFYQHNLRRTLPSELLSKPALDFPDDVSAVIGIAAPTLRKLRSAGDHPKLYAVGRKLFTTAEDLAEWIMRHEVEPGFVARPATRGRRVEEAA